jgi:menaquinone-dependent protoporphyrinogen oxidase
VLIVYGTGYGQTARIADYIAGKLRIEGDDVDVIDGHNLPTDLRVDRYDASIVGASVQAGRLQPLIGGFVKNTRINWRIFGRPSLASR